MTEGVTEIAAMVLAAVFGAGTAAAGYGLAVFFDRRYVRRRNEERRRREAREREAAAERETPAAAGRETDGEEGEGSRACGG